MIAASPAGDDFFNTTDLSWLHSWRLQPKKESHWEVFLARYFPYIRMRIAQYFLRPQDGEDLQQEILSKILLNIQSVKRLQKGSFRSWLKQVVNSALCDWFKDAKRRRIIPLLDPAVIRDIAQGTINQIDEDYKLERMRKAIIQARFDLAPSTWDMFEQTKINGLSAAQVAALHKVSVLTVYDAVRRVMERLRELIRQMEQSEED